MPRFTCHRCDLEVTSLFHKCGRKEKVLCEVIVGGTGWGRIIASGKSKDYE